MLTYLALFNWRFLRSSGLIDILFLDIAPHDIVAQRIVKLRYAGHVFQERAGSGQRALLRLVGIERTHNFPYRLESVEMEDSFQAGHWVVPDRERHELDMFCSIAGMRVFARPMES